METEQRWAARHAARVYGGAVPLNSNGTLPELPRTSRGMLERGLALVEVLALLVFGLGLGSTVLHLARPECRACVACVAGAK